MHKRHIHIYMYVDGQDPMALVINRIILHNTLGLFILIYAYVYYLYWMYRDEDRPA